MDLDDVNQGVLFLPYIEPDELGDESRRSLADRGGDADLGHIRAYKQSWNNCLDQIRSIVTSLYDPVMSSILQAVQSPHSMKLPGLPRSELPVVCITDSTSGSHFVDAFNERLNKIVATDSATNTILATHIYPTECNNLSSFMKSMISGFVDSELLNKSKGKPSTSLANYDIDYLRAWCNGVLDAYETSPTLIVLLHDFEQFDRHVMEDVFYICSQHAAHIPLIFVLSLSSPHLPSYLHLTYPRSTLALLRIQTFVVPNRISILLEIVEKTFFALDFEPDIMIGPTALKFIVDHFSRQNASIDSFISILQIIHLKHVTSHPLGFLASSISASSDIETPEAAHLVEELFIHVQALSSTSRPKQWPNLTLSDLLDTVDHSRSLVQIRLRCYRLSFHLFVLVQTFMTKEGYKGLEWNQSDPSFDILRSMIELLQGRLARNVKQLGMMIRKLKPSQLASLVNELMADLDQLPSVNEGDDPVQSALEFLSQLPIASDDQDEESNAQIAQHLGGWFVRYVGDLQLPIEQMPLWDLWYTGQTPFPSELLNPSIRASILAALLRPHEFARLPTQAFTAQPTAPALWELPDTSILFRRYLDSGKMINAYDWFESFLLVLESQQENMKKQNAKERNRASPKKRARDQSSNRDGDGGDEGEDHEDHDEQWRIQVQARFMRALQELDYLGFIKHTGRKPDHVQRTVFDIQD